MDCDKPNTQIYKTLHKIHIVIANYVIYNRA